MLVIGFAKVTTFTKTLFHKYSPTNNRKRSEIIEANKPPNRSGVAFLPNRRAAVSFLTIILYNNKKILIITKFID